MADQFIDRHLVGLELKSCKILEMVSKTTGTQKQINLFFDGPIEQNRIIPPETANLVDWKTIGNAACATYEMPSKDAEIFTIDGERHHLTPAGAEYDFFTGRNTILAERNGETVATVTTWIAHHIRHHNLQAVALLDRARVEDSQAFSKELRKNLTAQGLDCNVAVVSSTLPLGKPNLPHESHPFCVPGAPGKDRMTIPDADPWGSPLAILSIFEMLRVRFLTKARAVANINVSDLLPATPKTVFDQTIASETGVVQLLGRQCYPWRVRSGEQPQFGDHICVQFDAPSRRRRWSVDPAKIPEDAAWRLVRIGSIRPDPKNTVEFYRYMALRHPNDAISKIVPKSSLIEHPPLLANAAADFDHKPVRMPDAELDREKLKSRGRAAIVTTMKNEGPFILEWLAYHWSIGFDDIIVYTNDCTDGTDTMLDMLQGKGLLQHRNNPFQGTGLKPQHAALQAAQEEDVIKNATWVTCIDVDEYVNIKTGDGTLDALFSAVPDANMISMTWRLFGNGNVHEYHDRPITEQFLNCAPEFANKPHQAWGFKTLFRNLGIFNKLGVHRPKGLKPQLWQDINWINGSGKQMPKEMYRNAWRSTSRTYGYDLIQLNHYAVRSAESFLVKRDRGRVNHVDRDQGLAYWFRMNNNAETDHSIQPKLDAMRAKLTDLMSDPDIARAHSNSVKCHQEKISQLKATEKYAQFYSDLTGQRLEKLSRLHGHFGANVFLSGPDVVPDDVVAKDPDQDWFFTVEDRGGH